MKKQILSLLLLIFWLGSSAQKIHFSDTTNSWKVFYYFCGDWRSSCSVSNYNFSGDTTISGNRYLKLSNQFFKEDSISKKIFTRAMADTSDLLLYDFSLRLGDTFRSPHAIHHVSSFDSVTINGFWHHVWHMKGDSLLPPVPPMNLLVDYDIIEGIGTDKDLLFPLHPYTFEGCISLTCFTNKGNTPPLSSTVGIYFNNSSSCNLTFGLAVGEPKLTTSTFVVRPNPARSTISVTNNEIIKTLSVTNLVGQPLLSITPYQQEIELNIASFPPGIYILKINENTFSRLVKE